VLGVIAGFIWVPIMGYLQKDKYEYSYAGSISVAFLIFIIVQYLNGSGPIAALIFGIIVSNGEEIFKWFRYKDVRNFTMTSESKRFNNLITFFTSAFFFVYLGALVSFSDVYAMLIGAGIAAALIIARFISTPIALARSQYTEQDKINASYMVSRGMGAGVLATLPIAYGISGTGSFINIIFVVIVATIIFNSVAALVSSIKEKRGTSDTKSGGQDSKPVGAQQVQNLEREPPTRKVVG
jgi:NhaP-type Na+/H+ or K+/H+ antiporter